MGGVNGIYKYIESTPSDAGRIVFQSVDQIWFTFSLEHRLTLCLKCTFNNYFVEN